MTDDLSRAVYASETAHDADAGAIRFGVVRDFGDTINVTFRFLREALGELGPGLLVFAGPVALLSSLAATVAQARMMETMTAAADDPFAMLRFLGSPAFIGSMLLGLIAPFLVWVLTLAYTQCYRRGEAGTVTPGRLWAAAQPLLVPMGLLYLATTVALVLCGLVNLIPCLGSLAFLGGLVYAAPALNVAFVVRAEEGTGVAESWRRARDLVRGQWGQSFGVVAVSSVLVFAVAMVIGVVVAIPSGGIGALTGGGGAPSTLSMALTSLLSALSVLGYVLPATATAFLYHGLAERDGAAGLGADIAALARPPAPPPEPDPTFMSRPAAVPTSSLQGTPAASAPTAPEAPASSPSPSLETPAFGAPAFGAPVLGAPVLGAPALGAAVLDETSAPTLSPTPDASRPASPAPKRGGFRGGGFDDPASDAL